MHVWMQLQAIKDVPVCLVLLICNVLNLGIDMAAAAYTRQLKAKHELYC